MTPEPPQTGLGKKVCVTGASGFIASHIVKQLLERGYSVNATVRDAANDTTYGWIKKLAEGTPGVLELFTADLMKPGSFDAAVEGCEYVCHVAAAVTFTSKDPRKDIVDPSLEGTRNVLTSVIKAQTAKRVVLTSSVAAVADDFSERGKTYTEEDWHHECSLKNPYGMAKTLAEKLAWKMAEEQKAKGGWSFELVVVNPALVLGDILHASHGKRGTVQVISQLLDGSSPLAPDFHWSIVHVRDVALAHILALETSDAKGRYLVSDEGLLSTLDIARVIKTEYPNSKAPTMLMPTALLYAFALVTPGLGIEAARRMAGRIQYFSNKKAKADLGIAFIAPDKTILDTSKSLIESGIVPPPASEPPRAFPFLPRVEDFPFMRPAVANSGNPPQEPAGS